MVAAVVNDEECRRLLPPPPKPPNLPLGSIDLEEFRSEMKNIMLAISDGLSEWPIQMVLEDQSDNLPYKAANLEASKLAEASYGGATLGPLLTGFLSTKGVG